MKRNARLVASLLLLGTVLGWMMPLRVRASEPIPLAGEWRFSLDAEDAGVIEKWFTRDLAERIKLPGALQSQGFGDEISTKTPWVLSLYDRLWYERADYKTYTRPGSVKVPFLSQPPRHYLGAAWYQREIEIPREWQEQRVVLNLERPHWETTVWVDERKIGSNNSLVAPHTYDLGELSAGKHRLTIRVDNRLLMPYRPDAHSVSDLLAGSWNGIVGRIELTATRLVWIDDAQVFPNVAKKSALIKVRVGNQTGQSVKGLLTARGLFAVPGQPVSVPVALDASGGKAELEVPLGAEAKTWDEFHPVLQRLVLQLRSAQGDDSRELVFGLRELRAEGNQFLLNGRPVIFRGTHHGGDFPLTGYPPTDVEYWKKIIRICQAWGLNHMRFHSFCPPEAAFTAADELGFYLQPEPGMWNEISPGTPMERMLYEETERMTRAYGNHPSYLLLSPSNEPKGRWTQSLPRWAEHYRREDPRRLYTNGTGHTEKEVPNLTEGVDFLVVQRVGQSMLRGNSAWFGQDYRESLAGINVPVLSHELGQWVAYPDYDVIKKFKGYMRPGNYEIFRDSMAAHGLLNMNKEFAQASSRYQLQCYKEEIEANLRTPGLGGFQLLDLHDYLGQGTALVGLLDAFWEEKNAQVTAAAFRPFCGPTVMLSRMKRVFTGDEQLEVEVEIAHYGDAPIENATPMWSILDERLLVYASGRLPSRTIPLGKNIELGKINLPLSRLPAPHAYILSVGLQGGNSGSNISNYWDLWLYPARDEKPAPRDVLITRSWDEAEARLAAGGKVLYTPGNAQLDWTSPPLDRVPVFWNRLMGPAWGRMLGTWNDAKHPALAGFPTAKYFDWQWAEIITGVRAVNMERLPRELRPIVYAIDDWNRNYRLGLLFECRVGRGKLLVSAFDLESSRETNAVARQLRRSLLDYMASSRFRPAVGVSATDIRALLFDTRVMHRLGAVAGGEAQAQNPAANAVDGDPNTFWMVGDPKKVVKRPHELAVRFNAPVPMRGVVLMSRQNHREHEGDIREYVVEVSDDGKVWREVTRGTLASTFEPQQVLFARDVTARYLKLTSLSGFGPDTTSALAELAVMYTGPKLAGEDEGQLEYQRSRTATPDIDEGTNVNPRPKASPHKRGKP